MNLLKNSINLGSVSEDIGKLTRTQSLVPYQSADTLFTFMKELSWLLEIIQKHMLTARYCVEDIKYLNLKAFEKIAIPMKCFCDINLHKLQPHLEYYGEYGIAFSKSWGISKLIQPVQYIVENSDLANSFTEAFKESINNDDENLAKSYLPMHLMYLKPVSGTIKNRCTEEEDIKYFTDESEWRYVPDVSKLKLKQIIVDQNAIKIEKYNTYNDAIMWNKNASLKFDYKDIRYIIIKNKSDFDIIVNVIDKLKISKQLRYSLISKIIIWEESRRDF